MQKLLEGAYDLHVHAAPDVVERIMDDMELAKSYQEAGMKGFLIKAHYFNTAGRAYHVKRLFPEMQVFGAVTLNNSMGGLNPYAVRQGGMLGAKFVFMPTMDARNMWDYLEKTGAPLPFGVTSKNSAEVMAIRMLKEDGSLVEPLDEILDIIKEYDMVLCTGHISSEEALEVLRRGQEKGIKKMIATHVEWPAVRATLERQKEYVMCGAYLEHNIANIMSGDLSVEELVEQIHEIGAEHMILSTDLGQACNPAPAEMFELYVQKLLDAGATEKEIRQMIVENPEKLVK